MRKFLAEPLVHFLAIGVAVFAAYAWIGDAPREQEIVVTAGQQKNLIASFERSWQRPPTPAELGALVKDYVRQEIAYREAGAMELDRNDIVIRRRLRQKLELLTEDLASLTPPTEQEIETYYSDNAALFRADMRFSFDQLYFSLDGGAREARSRANAALDALLAESGPPDSAALGDRTSLPPSMRNADRREVASTFGSQFAGTLESLPIGRWTGPVSSGFGLHLVRLNGRVAGQVPPLSDIAPRVRDELIAARRRDAIEGLYERLGERYRVRVEPLDGSTVNEDPGGRSRAAAGATE